MVKLRLENKKLTSAKKSKKVYNLGEVKSDGYFSWKVISKEGSRNS